MAHVFLAHRVRSIHIEKDTNLLENTCDKPTCINTIIKRKEMWGSISVMSQIYFLLTVFEQSFQGSWLTENTYTDQA